MDFSGIEKFSLVDFESKVSATLFFGGCNYRCPFCHNKDLVKNPHLLEKIPFDEILKFLRSRKGFIDAVVISGGEPTLMSDLKEKLVQIKELGFLVKLDSNGTNPEVLKDLVNSNLIDYIAMDIKNSFSKYDLTTDSRVQIEKIKDSISFIVNSGVDHEFRTTVVKEFHTIDDIKEIAAALKGAKRMRIQKFVSNGNCINENLHEIDIDTANLFVSELKKTISDVSLRGY